MKRLLREDFELLESKYKKLLEEIHKVKVCRALKPSDIRQLNEIYERCGYKLHNPNCGSCVFTMVDKLADKFYEYMELIVKEEVMAHDGETIKENIKEEKKIYHQNAAKKRNKLKKEKENEK